MRRQVRAFGTETTPKGDLHDDRAHQDGLLPFAPGVGE